MTGTLTTEPGEVNVLAENFPNTATAANSVLVAVNIGPVSDRRIRLVTAELCAGLRAYREGNV